MTRCTWILALLPVTIALIAAPSAAGALKLEKVRFRATLSASQSTTWTIDTSDSCGTRTGSGSQKMTFRNTKKRFVLIFARYKNHDGPIPPVRVAGDPAGIPIKGSITREGKLAETTNPLCQGSGQPGGTPKQPPASDCGTKAFSGHVQPHWWRGEDYPARPGALTPLTPVLSLEEPQTNASFVVCPWYGPLVLFRLTHAGLPINKVFGRSPKLKVSDRVTQVNTYPYAVKGARSVSTISWTLRLTRLR